MTLATYRDWLRRHEILVQCLEGVVEHASWLLPDRFSSMEGPVELFRSLSGAVAVINGQVLATSTPGLGTFLLSIVGQVLTMTAVQFQHCPPHYQAALQRALPSYHSCCAEYANAYSSKCWSRWQHSEWKQEAKYAASTQFCSCWKPSSVLSCPLKSKTLSTDVVLQRMLLHDHVTCNDFAQDSHQVEDSVRPAIVINTSWRNF